MSSLLLVFGAFLFWVCLLSLLWGVIHTVFTEIKKWNDEWEENNRK